jgi:hypothetical protein
MDVLRYLDAQEQAVDSAGWEYRLAAARLASLGAVQIGRKNRERSPSDRAAVNALRREPDVGRASDESVDELYIQPAETAVDAERCRELFEMVKDRQRARFGETPVVPNIRETESRQDDLTPSRGEAAAEVVQWERIPGHFGKGGWRRQSNPH